MTESRIAAGVPTKRFFIEIITKDISLIPAINDLVDNAIDGAKRLGAKTDFTGYEIRLTVNNNEFRIIDNCGGIPLETAETYAFRFGRAEGFPDVEHSVGQFGVGMKRALFKLGQHFVVDSDAGSSRFTLSLNVEEWARNQDDWSFELTDVQEFTDGRESEGTSIVVDELHDSVSKDMGTVGFLNRLRDSLESSHRQMIEIGLAISLNGEPIGVDVATLLASDDLNPAYYEASLNHGESLLVKVYAGVASSSPGEAGWYIFCNGRQVVEADQSNLTGWGEGGGSTIPKYHNQFSRFRGFVFLIVTTPVVCHGTPQRRALIESTQFFGKSDKRCSC